MKRLLFLAAPLARLPGTLRRHPRVALFGAVLLLGAALGAYHGARQLRARDHQRSALAALERWDFRQARADLAYCLEVWPSDGYTNYLAAQADRRGGFFDDAETHLEQAERAGYRKDQVLLEWSLLRAQRGDVAEIEAPLLRRVAQDDLESPLILEALALGYIHIYQLPKAGRCLDQLLERQPHNVFALVWRAHCLEGIGVPEKAIEDYYKAIELDPEYDEARLRLADRLVVRMKSFHEAIEQYEVLRRRQPANARVAIGMARCRRLTGKPALALEILEEVLKAHPDDLDALAERGQIALDAGQPEAAAIDLRRAVAGVRSPDRHVLHGLYRALRQMGKNQEAALILARGEQMDEDLKQMGSLLKEIGAHPADASLYCRAATICRRNGQDSEALRWLGGALSRDPAYAPAHAALADYYERTGAPNLAQQHRRLAKQAARSPIP